MKTIIKMITIFAMLAGMTIAQAQTTRCVKNWDGSVTCRTNGGGGGF